MVKHITRSQNNGYCTTEKNIRLKWFHRIFSPLLFIFIIYAIVFWISLPNVNYLVDNNPHTTAFIELRKIEAVKQGARYSLRWEWRSLKKISPYLRYAVVKAEDRMFWSHDGVDWSSIRKILGDSLKEKKLPERGGSTITQQLAKNLYLSPSKNPIRKLKEFIIAKRLESVLSKSRILELYLNTSEWGDGIFGAEAAVQKWYAVSASVLKPSQAARLAVALPNPFKLSVKHNAVSLNFKASRLLRSMRKAGLISQDELELGFADLGLTWRIKMDKLQLSKQ